MTSSAIEPPWSVHAEKPVRLRSLRSGLRRVKKALKRCAAAQTGFARITEAEDYVSCIQHEVRFLEEYPPQALGQVQQERLEYLCRGVLVVLKSDADQNTRPLQEAFRNLMPLLAKDFDQIRKATV